MGRRERAPESGAREAARSIPFGVMTLRPLVLGACAAVCVATTACPAPLSRGARAQDAAQELNLQARFGRLSVAMERVAPKERDNFTKRHKAWGNTVRISDTEMAGLRLTGDEDAEVAVRVAWFRPSEGELRVTTLRQKWHDHRGDWLLVDEERADGDAGLLGDDPPASAAPAKPRTNAQFPTIRIGEGH